MKNKLKQILTSKLPAIGTWISMTDPYGVEMVAGLGFDWLLIDMEHIPITKETLLGILMACKGSESVPIVRVASSSAEHFQAALDMGAQGVMAPMINTAADAALAVQYCRYPPQGRRGFGPLRAARYMKEADSYRREANEEMLLFVQIETPEAVQNASAIISTPGIDGIFIGNGDLANFLNGDAKAGSANVQKVVDDLIAMANKASIPIGLPTWSPEEFSRYAKLGAQLLTIGGDLAFLAVQAEAELAGVRRMLNGGEARPGKP
jgi:2-keto-3-deoxy-L-rhamnonate aldolase RhmA